MFFQRFANATQFLGVHLIGRGWRTWEMSPIRTPTHHLIPRSPPITSPPWHVQRLVGILGRRRSYTTLHDLWYLVCHTCDSVTYPIRDVG